MAIRIEETFRVRAPVERVWSYLLDPRQVVGCLPGAELVDVEDERTFVGKIRVKVGPVTASYKGRAELLDVDEQAHRVRMRGTGQDTSGAGSATMTMTSHITAAEDGAAEVRVNSELELVGKLVQFGRGMIEEVSKQLFRQFAQCVQSTLEAEGGEANGGPTGDAADAGASASPAGEPASGPAAGAARERSGGATAEARAGAGTRAEAGAAAGGTSGAAAEAAGRPATPSAAAAAPAAPVRALPLVLRAIWARIARFFGRRTDG